MEAQVFELDGLWDYDTACKYLNLSKRVLEKLVSRGEIDHYKFGRGRRAPVRFKKEHLDRYREKFRMRAITA